MPPLIPPGFEIVDDFSINGEVTSVVAGVGYLTVVPTVLATLEGGRNGKIYIAEISPQVIDPTGNDQIYFSLRRNRLPVALGFNRIPAVMFQQNQRVQVGEVYDGGLFEIVAFNKSGTAETGASAAIDIQCQAGWKGYILKQKKEERFLENYISQSQRLARL
jgi:hypothetical protein